MGKSRDAFRTISEVSDWLDTPAHVLRFWESKFTQVKPVKRAGGRRYYRPDDMELLGGIKTLLHDQGMTIKGVQRLLRDSGAKHVAGLGPRVDDDDDTFDIVLTDTPADVEIRGAAQDIALPPAQAAAAEPPSPDPMPAIRPTAHRSSTDIPADPQDDDLNPPSRFFAAFQRADSTTLRRRAAQIAPLVARLETVRASLARD